MRAPTGLRAGGKKLWRQVNDEFDLDNEPHKQAILAQACKVIDIITELDEAADEAPLTVRGSQQQPVINPLIAEARAQKSLLAQLLARLNFEDA